MSEAEPPREGIPDCVLGLAIHPDGRVAGWANCRKPTEHVKEYLAQVPGGSLCYYEHIVQAGFVDMAGKLLWHGLTIPQPRRGTGVLEVQTNTHTEAKTAWQRAQEWVRTGELE